MSGCKQFIFPLLILLAFLANIQDSPAQSHIDSLKNSLEKSVDSGKVDILVQLSNELKFIDPELAVSYAADAISLAREIGYKQGETNAFIRSGNAYRKLGDFYNSIESYEAALVLGKELQNKNSIARAFNGLGIAYSLLGDFDKSIDAFFSSLKTYEEDGDQSGIAHALNNIGISYHFMGELNKALEHYEKALVIRKEIGDQAEIAGSLNNIGDVYVDMGNGKKSLEYLLEALEIQKGFGNNDLIFALNVNIGTVYESLGNHHIAITYYQKGLEIVEEIGDNWGIAETYNFLGSSYLKLNNHYQANRYLNLSLDLAKKIDAKIIIKQCYEGLYNLYSESKDYQKSLEYYKLYAELKDSIFSETSSKQIAEIQILYETEKNELEIIQLTSEKAIQDLKLNKSENLKWFFIIATILVLLLTAFIYYAYQQKQKANAWLKERNKFEIEKKNMAVSLFGQQVSKEVALELLSDSFNAHSKKLFACIMFLDIRNFTPFAESKEPSEIIKYQNDVFGFMIDIISKYHGIINQFLGDGFMATFGAPASSGKDSQNAVNASLEIVEKLKQKCDSGEIPQTKVGIGLHAGNIVTGNVGTSERKQYSITGNTVILASRIEQLNKKFESELLITKEVFENLDQNDLKTKNLGPVEVKGRAEPMDIIRLA